jgi:hypothetical protein
LIAENVARIFISQKPVTTVPTTEIVALSLPLYNSLPAFRSGDTRPWCSVYLPEIMMMTMMTAYFDSSLEPGLTHPSPKITVAIPGLKANLTLLAALTKIFTLNTTTKVVHR